MKRIFFCGGGSGGHFYPILAIIRELRELGDADIQIFYSAPDYYGKEIIEKEGVEFHKVSSGKLRRYFSFLNFLDIFKFTLGVLKSFFVLWKIMPDFVFGKGGYGSLPVLVVSFIYRIPIILHESDTIPGLVNKIFAKYATLVIISFESSKQFFDSKKTIDLGNPIRESLLRELKKEEAIKFFNLNPSKKTILILGGSQGALALNNLVFSGFKKLTKDYNIIHQAGEGKAQVLGEEIKKYYGEKELDKILIFDFFEEDPLALAYNIADLVISRAGSGAIFEIAALGKPCILIPLLGSAGQHQKANAYEYAKSGSALIIEEPNIDANLLYLKIKELFANDKILKEMSQNAKKFAKPEAAQEIAKILIELLK